MRKYFTTKGRKWIFKSEEGQNTIINVAKIPIVRWIKVKSGMRVHDGSKETREYWKKRELVNAYNQIYSVKVEKLYKRQKGMCVYCGQGITQEQIASEKVHVHHMNPRAQGGDEQLNNLRLVHLECHIEAHSILSRELMSHWWKMKGNYMTREKFNLRCHPVTVIWTR